MTLNPLLINQTHVENCFESVKASKSPWKTSKLNIADVRVFIFRNLIISSIDRENYWQRIFGGFVFYNGDGYEGLIGEFLAEVKILFVLFDDFILVAVNHDTKTPLVSRILDGFELLTLGTETEVEGVSLWFRNSNFDDLVFTVLELRDIQDKEEGFDVSSIANNQPCFPTLKVEYLWGLIVFLGSIGQYDYYLPEFIDCLALLSCL